MKTHSPALCALAMLVSCTSVQGTQEAKRIEASVEPPAVRCAAGYETLESGACLAVPEGSDARTPIVMFLHGMFPDDHPEAELEIEARLGRLATAQGFSILALRGELGLCDWSADFVRWRCWPNHAQQKPKGGELLRGLAPHFRAVSRRLRTNRVEPFVMGFSNGAYFASFIAADTKLPVRGYAVLHGGPLEPAVFRAERAAPSLLISAEDDRAQKPRMDKLHELMNRDGWPHEYQTRAGGHELTDADIDRTLAFFAQSASSGTSDSGASVVAPAAN